MYVYILWYIKYYTIKDIHMIYINRNNIIYNNTLLVN